jgi:hypothetical protein
MPNVVWNMPQQFYRTIINDRHKRKKNTKMYRKYSRYLIRVIHKSNLFYKIRSFLVHKVPPFLFHIHGHKGRPLLSCRTY